mgnify:CR=1 FL=1
MGNIHSYQVGSVDNNDTPNPNFKYDLSVNKMTSHSIVDGVETTQSGGVTSVKTRSPEAGVMIGGISVSPQEAEAFQRELENSESTEEIATPEVDAHAFDNNLTSVLNDIDRGDLANLVNEATLGSGLNDDTLARGVSSLGMSDKESAIEVGNNLVNALRDPFDKIAREEGMEGDMAFEALLNWNKTKTRDALNDWIVTDGLDANRLRDSMREAWNAYGRADNEELVEGLKADGFEVQRTSGGGIALRGGGYFDDWTVWSLAREMFRKQR